jgi:hypothetical protein
MGKRSALLVIAVLAVSSLMMVESAFAQSIPTPSVPEFTLRYADHSYDTPATHSIDPYTGQEITHPGYHVENKTIEAVIKNNVGASYYNFRIKGHYADKWMFGNPDFYDAFSVTNAASASDYSVITVVELSSLPQSVSKGGKIDVQVQGLFGTYRAVVYGPKLGRTAYDFYFNGTASDWSNTQTITISESQAPTPSPITTPTPPPTSSPPPTPYSGAQLTEQEIIIGVTIAVVVIGAGLALLIYLINRK